MRSPLLLVVALAAAAAVVALAAAAAAAAAAAGGEDPCPSQDAPLSAAEHAAWEGLARLYNSTGGARWSKSSCWDAVTPRRVCDGDGRAWHGVRCSEDGVVDEIRLKGNNLSGPVPNVWSGLNSVEEIDLSANPLLEGPVPSHWEGVDGMMVLYLNNCDLKGTLPSHWSGVSQLRTLYLYSNGLSGTFPEEWSGMGALRGLHAGRNAISGGGWRTVSGLSLVDFDMPACRLTGTVPSEWSHLQSGLGLARVTLRSNMLSGTFPSTVWSGADTMESLDLSNNAISGTLPAHFRGLSSLDSLLVRGCRLSGEFPGQWSGLDKLTRLDAAMNALSGSFLSPGRAPLAGLPQLVSLDVSQNAISGGLDWGALRGVPRMGFFQVSANSLSGTLPGVWPSFLDRLEVVDVSENAFEGPLPPLSTLPAFCTLSVRNNRLRGGLPPDFFAVTDRAVGIKGNLFTSMEEALGPGANASALPLGSSLDLSQNKFAGAVPDRLCEVAAESFHLDLSNNLITRLPACVASMSELRTLSVAANRLQALPLGLGTDARSSLRALRAEDNGITGLDWLPAEAAAVGSAPLEEVWLDENPLGGLRLDDVVSHLQVVLPRLHTVHMSRCSLSGLLTTNTLLTSIDVSGNNGFVGFEGAISSGPVEVLDVSDTAYTFEPDGDLLSRLRAYSRAGVVAPSCLPPPMLRSLVIESVDVRRSWTGFHPSCLARTLDGIEAVEGQQRFFADLDLTCPQWRVASAARAGGLILAGADFALRELCRCSDGLWWDADAEACAAVGIVAAQVLRVDPYVLHASPCVSVAGVYPVDRATGRLPANAARLPAAAFVACRQPGVCGQSAPACAARGPVRDKGHSHRSAPPADAFDESAFACATGRDRESLLCSRCAAGHWRSGDACVPCHRKAFLALVPLSLALSLAALLWFAWRLSGRPSDGYRTLSIALLWLQLSALLEASSQAQSGGAGSTTTWSWLASVRATAQSWAVFRPWALRCVAGGGYGFVDASYGVLLAPAAVAALGALARLVLRARPRPRRRVVFVCGFLLQSAFLPVVTRALEVVAPCESAAGGAAVFVSAAPYVSCDDPRLPVLRAVAAVTLVAYCTPLVAATALALWRARRISKRGGLAAQLRDRGRPQIQVPMLLEDDDAAGDDDDDSVDASVPASLTNELLLASLRDRHSLWHWPLTYELGRGLAIACMVALVPVTSPLQAVGVYAVLAAAALAHARARPWRRALDNTLELVVLLASLGVYLLTIVGGADASRSASTAAAGRSSSTLGSSSVRAVVSIVDLAVLAVLAAALTARSTLERKLLLT